MRGGAIPLLIWALLLGLLLGTNWVWTGDRIQFSMLGFGVFSIICWALAFILMRRDALRRGAPPPDPTPRALPSASYGAAMLAFGGGVLIYGFVYGQVLVFFGIGLMTIAIVLLTRELVFQRRARNAVRRRGGT